MCQSCCEGKKPPILSFITDENALFLQNSNAYITDMGSRHRTSVIGVVLPPLEEKQLIPGNSFCIGKNRDRLL